MVLHKRQVAVHYDIGEFQLRRDAGGGVSQSYEEMQKGVMRGFGAIKLDLVPPDTPSLKDQRLTTEAVAKQAMDAARLMGRTDGAIEAAGLAAARAQQVGLGPAAQRAAGVAAATGVDEDRMTSAGAAMAAQAAAIGTEHGVQPMWVPKGARAAGKAKDRGASDAEAIAAAQKEVEFWETPLIVAPTDHGTGRGCLG